MAYIEDNPKTKAELKRWVADPERKVRIQVNSPFAVHEGALDYTGRVSIEGPHFPKMHTWWGTAEVANGVVVKVS